MERLRMSNRASRWGWFITRYFANMPRLIKRTLRYTEIFSVWKAADCDPAWMAASTWEPLTMTTGVVLDLAEVACVVVLQPLHVVVGEAVVVEVSEEDEGEGLCGGCGGQAHGREGGGAAGLKKNGDGRACRINVRWHFVIHHAVSLS